MTLDHDAPDQVALRKNQGDPIIMYLIVRESLNMSAGKIGAQCGHAAQMALLQLLTVKNLFLWLLLNVYRLLRIRPQETAARLGRLNLFRQWLKTSFRKVVLRADDKEWEKVKACSELTYVIVRDAGLTEVEAGSETVIGVFPLLKSEAPKVLKRLQVLK